MVVTSLAFPRNTTSQQICWSSGLHLQDVSWTLVANLYWRSITWGWTPHDPLISALWPITIFCDGLLLLQRKTSLIRGNRYTSLWVQSLILEWFSKVELIDYPLRSITSVTPGTWLCLYIMCDLSFVEQALSTIRQLLVTTNICVITWLLRIFVILVIT